MLLRSSRARRGAGGGLSGRRARAARRLGSQHAPRLSGRHVIRAGRHADPSALHRDRQDESGVDETVVARRHGWSRAVGGLLSCPMCVGRWASLALTAGRVVAPGQTRILVSVLAIAALAELNNGAVELLE
ncbi:MAG: DUF1360 domain-containing protein [Chloroflexi bacterium]|nr:DUF1360 domain-containing protein [Chloroflexota bacterium]